MSIQTNLYDYELYFAIIYNNEYNYVIEPSGWDKIQNRIPRDPTFFGFCSDFLEDKYGMMFTFIKDGNLTGGAELLKDIAESIGKGPDSIVFFEFGKKSFETIIPINRWRINLNEYSCEYPGGVSTSIEKMPLQGKFRARMSTPCTANGYATIDGQLLTPISDLSVRLHSKTLLQNTKAISVSPQQSNQISTNQRHYYVLQPDQSSLAPDELKTVFSQPLGLIDTFSETPVASGTPQSPITSGLDILPFDDVICQYTAATNGNLNISYNCKGDLYWYKNGDDLMWWDATVRVVIQRYIAGIPTVVDVIAGTTQAFSANPGGSIPNVTPPATATYPFDITPYSDILPGVTGGARTLCVKVSGFVFSENFNDIQVLAGDNIYVQIVMCPPFTGGTGVQEYVQFENFTNNIAYSQLTTTKSSQSSGYRIFDIINQQLEAITGYKNRLISTFFSEGGYGYEYALLNGYSIRNYESNIYLLKKDLQSLLEDLQALFCIGYGFKTISGEEYMVIEHASYFFQDKVIARYPMSYNWKTKINVQYLYNSASFGFNKYEGVNIIQQDEICTEADYSIQTVKYNNNILSKKSGLIASGYILEQQRRNQFLLNPGQSLSFDTDVFIVALSEPCKFTNIDVNFVDSNSTIHFFTTSMALLPGDVIVSASGTNAGIEYTVVSQVEGFPKIGNDEYYVTPTPIYEVASSDVTIIPPSPNIVFAERNQPFEICEGVTDPSTIYNGRLTPKHILYNWANYLQVGAYFIDVNSIDYSVSQIVPTYPKMNSLFSSKFLSSEVHKGAAGVNNIVENVRERIKDIFKNSTPLFTPKSAECNIKIGFNEFNTLRFALSGSLGDSTKDNGGIILTDDFGKDFFCQVMNIDYNPKDQIAKLEVNLVYPVLPVLPVE